MPRTSMQLSTLWLAPNIHTVGLRLLKNPVCGTTARTQLTHVSIIRFASLLKQPLMCQFRQ
jgi:hypothetical protein